MAGEEATESTRLLRFRAFTRWLRPIGTLALIGFVASNRDFVLSTIDSLRRTDFAWLTLGVSLFAASLVASAVRVRLLLGAIGHSIPHRLLIGDATRAVGLSASLAIGAGDVFRVGRLRAMGVPLFESGLVIAVDRAIGTLAIVATGVVCFATSGRALVGIDVAPAVAWSVGGFALAAGAWLALRIVRRVFSTRIRILADSRIRTSVALTSAVVLALWLGSVVSIARSVGIEVGVGALALAASWVTLATIVPLSIGGVGVREAGYVVLLSTFDVPAAQAVVLGLVQYLAMLVLSGIAWLAPLDRFGPAEGTPAPDCQAP